VVWVYGMDLCPRHLGALTSAGPVSCRASSFACAAALGRADDWRAITGHPASSGTRRKLSVAPPDITAPVRDDPELTQLGLPFGPHLDAQIEALSDQQLASVTDEQVGRVAGQSSLREVRNLIRGEPLQSGDTDQEAVAVF
jgi:hypothetical protein